MEPIGQCRGQIFEAMHSQIDFTCQQRGFDFFGKHAFSESKQGTVLDGIAGGFDDFEGYRHLWKARVHLFLDKVCLPECELAASRADGK